MMGLVSQFGVGLLLFLSLVYTSSTWAQVRSSSNFQMERDAISAGGALSTSSSYQLNDTVGQAGSGRGTSSSFTLESGFQQQPEVTLTLTVGNNAVMSPELGGITGGESTGSIAVNASTDGAAGYQLTVQATSSPAMRSGVDTIADYAPAGAVPDTTFTTTATDAHFGYSPFGPDIVDYFKISGGVCGSGGVASSTACWEGLNLSPTTIASAVGANSPAGATTTVHFRVGLGTEVTQPPGVYVATTTITLLSL